VKVSSSKIATGVIESATNIRSAAVHRRIPCIASAMAWAMIMGLVLALGCNAEQSGTAAPTTLKQDDSAAHAQSPHQSDGQSGDDQRTAALNQAPAAHAQSGSAWSAVAADVPFEPLGRLFEGFNSNEVGKVVLSPDERILLMGNRLYDLHRRCELPYLRTKKVFNASFSGDSQWLAVCNGRGTPPVTLFHLKDDTQQTFEDASYAAFSPRGTTLALIVEEGEAIRLIDAATGKPGPVIRGDLSKTETITFTPDGTRLLSTHYSQQPRMWDSASGKEIALPETRDRLSYAPVFSPDGRLLASGAGTAVYDTRSWEKVAEVDFPSTANDMRFAPDGSQLWVQCQKHVCVVDIAAGSVASKTSTPDNIYGGGFSHDGRQVWIVHHDRVEWYGRGGHPNWEPPQVATTSAMRVDKGDSLQLAFTPDGKTLVEQTSSGKSVLRDTATGTAQREIPPPESGSVSAAAVANTGPILYRFGGYQQGVVELLNLPEGSPVGEIRVPEGELKQTALSPDGRYLALSIEEGPLLLINAATGERLGAVESLDGNVHSLALAPGGEELAVVVEGGQDGVATVLKQFTLPDLGEKASHELHQQGGAHPSYSPDGRSLAVLEGYDIIVRDVATGRRTALIRGTTRGPFIYTADGRHIIAEVGSSYYDKKRLAAYNAGTGLVVHLFTGGAKADFQGARDILISPDGRFLVAAQGNGTVWWPMPEELVAARQVPSSPAVQEPGGSGVIAAARTIQPLRTRKFGTSRDLAHLGPDERTFHSVHWSRGASATIRRWDALAGQAIDTLVELGPAGLPALSSDDGRVWLAFHKGCDFWDSSRARIIASQSRERIETSIACLAPDGSFALFGGNTLVRHEPANGDVRSQLIATDVGHITALAVSPDGKQAAVATDGRGGAARSLQLIDLADPTHRQQMDLQDHLAPYTLRFTPDGSRLVGTYENYVLVWSTGSGNLLLHYRQPENGRALVVSPDGKSFATAGHDRDGYFIAVRELATGNLLARLVGVEFGASQLRFTADGKHLQAVEGTTHSTWRLSADAAQSGVSTESVDVSTAKLLHTFQVKYVLPAIRFADKGKTLAGDGTRISLATGNPLTNSFVIDPNRYRDGPSWMAGDGSRHLHAENDLLDRNTPHVRQTPRLLIWSPDDENHHEIALTVRDDAGLRPGTVALGDYRQIVANEQLNRVVTLQADNSAYLWALGNVHDAPQVNEKQAIDCYVKKLCETALCAEFSSAGDALAFGTPEGIELWNVANGEKVGQLEGPMGPIDLIRISPDRKVMVTFGSQGLQLWQVPTAQGDLRLPLLAQLAPPGHPVTDVCFSADSQRIGVALQDGPPRVYSAAGGQLEVECAKVDAGSRGVAFSPDGAYLAASCTDNTIRLWRLP